MGSTIYDDNIPYGFFEQCRKEEKKYERKPLYKTPIVHWEGECGDEWRDRKNYRRKAGSSIPFQFLIDILCEEKGSIQQSRVFAIVRDKWTRQRQNLSLGQDV